MTWLNGLPRRTRNLKPIDGANPSKTSILDDYILQFSCNSGKTTVYLADLTNDNEELQFEKISEIQANLCLVHLVKKIDGSDAVYASAEWNPSPARITLRLHSRDGTPIKETEFATNAAYGRLVVEGNLVAICTSSGTTPDGGDEFHNDLKYLNRGKMIAQGMEYSAPDQITVWDLETNNTYNVPLSQDPNCPMLHNGNFSFISPDKVALAGQTESFTGSDAGLLKCFSVLPSNEDYSRTFTQSQHTSRDLIQCSLGHRGSSEESFIFVHVHDGSRISIFNTDLLNGVINSLPTLSSVNLHQATAHRSYHRAIGGYIHDLAAISGNRILTVTDADPELDEDTNPVPRILDFDPKRVEDLVHLDLSAREELKTRLAEEGARVAVITRRFNINAVGEEDDQEYPYPQQPNTEWNDYLQNLYTSKLELVEEESEMPALEYEEPPEEHRNDVLFGYTDTRVKIPDGLDIDPARLALTKSALVVVPKYGDQADWIILDFEE